MFIDPNTLVLLALHIFHKKGCIKWLIFYKGCTAQATLLIYGDKLDFIDKSPLQDVVLNFTIPVQLNYITHVVV